MPDVPAPPDHTMRGQPGARPRPHPEPAGRLPPGLVIGSRFRIERLLGVGGFAEVYLANDLQAPAGQFWALKVLFCEGLDPQDTIRQQLAIRQAAWSEWQRQTAIKTRDHILECQAPDAIDDHNLHMVVLCLEVADETLRDWFKRGIDDVRAGKLEPSRRIQEGVRLLGQVCDGLRAVHGAGIHHLDLKPSNVLVKRENGTETVKLGDFGISRRIADDFPVAASPTGSVYYMAPEQAQPLNRQRIGPAADVYAIGAILYELLFQNPPVVGEAAAVLDALKGQSPPSISWPGDEHEWKGLIDLARRCLSWEPGERPGLDEIILALRDARPKVDELTAAWRLAYVGGTRELQRFLQQWGETRYSEAARERLREEGAWDGTRKAGSLPAYEDFIQQFPKGLRTPEATRWVEEEKAWLAVERKASQKDYELFLFTFKGGRYAKKAEERVLDFRDWFRADAADSPESYRDYGKKHPSGLFLEESEFRVAEQLWSPESYEAFLRNWPGSNHAVVVRERLGELRAWRNTVAAGSVDAYRAFLEEFPTGKRSTEARAWLAEEEAWIPVSSARDLPSCEAFRREFPEGRHLEEVTSRIDDIRACQKAEMTATVEAWMEYLAAFPSGIFRIDADWKVADLTGTTEAFERFLDHWPRSEYAALAQSRLADEKAWRGAVAAGTLASYLAYAKSFPIGRYARDARTWIEEENDWLKTDGTKSEPPYQGFLSRHPQGHRAESARTRLSDVAFWKQIQDEKSSAAYSQYLSEFPGGLFSSEATTWLASLEREYRIPVADPRLLVAFSSAREGRCTLAVGTAARGLILHPSLSASAPPQGPGTRVPLDGPVLALAWAPDGRHLLTGHDKAILHLLRPDGTRASQQTIPSPAGSQVLRISWNRDAARFAVALRTLEGKWSISLFSISSGRISPADTTWRIDGSVPVTALSWGGSGSFQGRVVVAVGDQLHLIDESDGSRLNLKCGRPVAALACSPDGGQFALGCQNGDIGILTDPGTPVEFRQAHKGAVTTLDWSPTGEWLASGDGGGNAVLQSVRTWRVFQERRIGPKMIQSLAWSENGWIAVAATGEIRFWPALLE